MRMNSHTCDACGKPATLAMKVWLSPVNPGDKEYKQRHSNYTKHADIGECCIENFMKGIVWRDRKTQARKVAA
jgi:hypothetical protein